MKFMVSWSIDQDKWLPILDMWASMSAAERADAGPGVSIIGRWHDTARRGGVLILETDDLPAMNAYLARWNPHMELDIAPVLDDDESAALAKAVVASNAG